MCSAALLIGFEYIESKDWKSLPGIPVDLYQAYSYSQTLTKTKTKNITVFTDVDKDYRTTVLRRAIIEGYVDSNLLSFIEDVKDNNHHTLYHSKKSNKYITNNFEEVIIKSVVGVTKLFVYYTGHAKNGHIILPDNTHVPLDHLKDIIVANASPNCEIIFVLDCCQSNGMELPYVYNNGYKLSAHNFLPNNIICLSSSLIDQDSTATRTGSIFTRNLFKIFKNNTIITIDNLISNITVNITTTYIEKLLFIWFTNPTKNNNINVNIETNDSIITVTLHNCQNSIKSSSSIQNYIRYLDKLDYR